MFCLATILLPSTEKCPALLEKFILIINHKNLCNPCLGDFLIAECTSSEMYA
jgi:hypothetical protein